MSDSELVKFSIKLSGIWWDKKPVARILLNGESIAEITVEKIHGKESDTIEFTKELNDGEHTLAIEFTNKTNEDTVHENGQILKDMLMSIDELTIDDIDLGYLAMQKGRFYVDRNIRPEEPEMMEKVPLVFGFPGRWEMKFTCPTYIWFLENL
jgi:hypothetical protein